MHQDCHKPRVQARAYCILHPAHRLHGRADQLAKESQGIGYGGGEGQQAQPEEAALGSRCGQAEEGEDGADPHHGGGGAGGEGGAGVIYI